MCNETTESITSTEASRSEQERLVMCVLHLTLKKKWFDMILSGVKKEEYREMKQYWHTRLAKKYNAILFRNGYAKDAPQFMIEMKGLYTGLGHAEWGAPKDKAVYILRLGKILST